MNLNLPEPKYKVEQIKDGNQHYYDITYEGKTIRVGGVTGALSVINKPALINWAKKEALTLVEDALLKRLNGRERARITLNKTWIKDVLDDAKKCPDVVKEQSADLGTQVHAFIEHIIYGEEPIKIPDEIIAPVNSYKEWWRNSGITLIAGELSVGSLTHSYGGCLDALGIKDNELIILDWKTSSGIFNEHALQVSAYAYALLETYGLKCTKAIVVRFGKKPPIQFEKKEVSDLNKSFEAFLAAKTLKELLSQSHFIDW